MDYASDENGDLALKNNDFYFVTGIDATVQFLSQRLRLGLGEWFLDESIGVPYLDEILIKNPNQAVVDARIKTVIIESPGVEQLISFEMSLDTVTRNLTISGRIKGLDGEADFSVNNIVPGG